MRAMKSNNKMKAERYFFWGRFFSLCKLKPYFNCRRNMEGAYKNLRFQTGNYGFHLGLHSVHV